VGARLYKPESERTRESPTDKVGTIQRSATRSSSDNNDCTRLGEYHDQSLVRSTAHWLCSHRDELRGIEHPFTEMSSGRSSAIDEGGVGDEVFTGS
jgi:6-phosphofructokinase